MHKELCGYIRNIVMNQFFRILCLLMFTSIFAKGQKTTPALSGTIQDENTKEFLSGAIVVIPALNLKAASDDDGKFSFATVKPGTYWMITKFIGYEKDSVRITVQNETPLVHDVFLSSKEVSLKNASVIRQKKVNTESSVVQEVKNSQSIAVGVSGQQISKTQDRDAGEVVRRLPGVNIMNDRFIMVRGLNERYNSVFLNGLQAPSVEPDSRAFAFDLIPSNMIDQLIIYKSPAPELPGDFAGGAIRINTKSFLEEGQLNISFAGSARPGSSFSETYQTAGDKYDFLAIDGHGRDLPNIFPTSDAYKNISNKDSLTPFARALSNSWSTKPSKVYVDTRFGASYTKGWHMGKWILGSMSSLNYSLTNTNYQIRRMDYDGNELTLNYKDDQYTQTSRIGALQSISFIYDNRHKIEFKGLFNELGKEQSTFRTGWDQNNNFNAQRAFYYQNRKVYTGQINGRSEFFGENVGVLTWVAGIANSSRNEPDYRRVLLKYDSPDPKNPTDSSKANYFIPIPSGSPDNRIAGRTFSNLQEKIYTYSAQYEHKFQIGGTEMKAVGGVFHEYKTREFALRWFGFVKYGRSLERGLQYIKLSQLDTIFDPDHIGTKTGFKLLENTSPSDAYTGTNLLQSYYAGLHIGLLKNAMEIYPGIRVENNVMTLNTFGSGNEAIAVKDPETFYLPSLNFTYHVSETQQLRAAYGKTLNRPEFRELAPFAFYDFESSRLIFGNPDLKTCTIDNYDLRYEWYPSTSELITGGLFYKNFKNPLEAVASANQGNSLFTYANAMHAVDYGFEIEARKQLNFWDDSSKFHSLMSRFSLVFNYAYIVSKVTLSDSIARSGITASRPLQGQSPYTVNVGLYYQGKDNKTQWNLMYNIIGPRIVYVGYPGYPDVYEMPRNSLDFSLTQKLNKYFFIRGSIQNALDFELPHGLGKLLGSEDGRQHLVSSNYILAQDKNADSKLDIKKDNILMNYRTGAYYTLSLIIKL